MNLHTLLETDLTEHVEFESDSRVCGTCGRSIFKPKRGSINSSN